MKEQAIKAITFAFDFIISFYVMVNETIGYFTLQIFSLQPPPILSRLLHIKDAQQMLVGQN